MEVSPARWARDRNNIKLRLTGRSLLSFRCAHTYSFFYRNTCHKITPPPQTIRTMSGMPVRNNRCSTPYAAALSPRSHLRDSGIFSSKTTPKLMLTSSRIWRVHVTRPRIAYLRSGCRMMPTASPGTTLFRELNFPPVSERAKTIAGWRVFSSDDSVSNVERSGRRPLTSSGVKGSFSSRTVGPLPSYEI